MTYTQSRRPGKNLLSFVDDPTIRKLLADGNGPSFLICGSRGGAVPDHLYQWRPADDGNAHTRVDATGSGYLWTG